MKLSLHISYWYVYTSKKRKSARKRQSSAGDLPSADAVSRASIVNQYQASNAAYYEEIRDHNGTSSLTPSHATVDNHEMGIASQQPSVPPQTYAQPHRPSPASPSSSPTAAAAAAPVISATGHESSVYNNTTTLVDNALYDVQQPPVTSSNVAETDDDVTDLTVIDNDLYEREGQGQGQQNAGSTDYECCLLYTSPSPRDS